ncbi:MAG: dicarboxylate/amino acid:cation symporter, partial [Moraxellaceae bacterium]
INMINLNISRIMERSSEIGVRKAFGASTTQLVWQFIVESVLLTSIGVAGIPSASLVAISVILGTIGLPAEGIGLLLVTDRILDMCRTAVNIFSDSCGAVVIARSEGEETKLL